MALRRFVYLIPALGMLMLTACSGPPEPGTPAPFPGVKVGKPYKIEGEWYRPSYDPDYVEEGYASWYGPGFHGGHTANGERFDQNAMTAAHKTLPMPSLVKVENLENGREIMVRVNDRGPFVDDRIIDLSKKAAEELGMRSKGLAKVRVSYMADETARFVASQGGVPLERQYAAGGANKSIPAPAPLPPIPQNNLPELIADNSRARAESAPVLSVRTANLALPPPPRDLRYPHSFSAPAEPPKSVASGSFIQAASFSDAGNAARLADRLASMWSAEVSPVLVKGKTWYRVHVGPIADPRAARQALDKLAAFGLPDARIITR